MAPPSAVDKLTRDTVKFPTKGVMTIDGRIVYESGAGEWSRRLCLVRVRVHDIATGGRSTRLVPVIERHRHRHRAMRETRNRHGGAFQLTTNLSMLFCFFSQTRPYVDHTGIIALHPHPTNPRGLAAVVAGNDRAGLVAAARLLPLRTGVPIPDWAVVTSRCSWQGAGGLAGAGFWDGSWGWSEGMSWMDRE